MLAAGAAWCNFSGSVVYAVQLILRRHHTSHITLSVFHLHSSHENYPNYITYYYIYYYIIIYIIISKLITTYKSDVRIIVNVMCDV